MVLWGLNFIFFNKNAPKSKATGETITLSFNNKDPVIIGQGEDFTVSLLAVPSVSTIIRGYKTRFNFDKAILNLKSIKYNIGVVSEGLGNTDANLTTINANGSILVVGEDTTSTGYTLTSPNGAELITLTFTALANAPTNVTIDESEFYTIASDATLSNTWMYAASSLSVNGGINPTGTQTCTPLPEACLQIYPDDCSIVAPAGGWCPPNGGGGGGNTGGNTSLNLKLKFQGITTQPKTRELNSMQVRAKIGGCGLTEPTDYMTGSFSADTNAVWSGSIEGFNLPACDSGFYTVYVKGPMHIQKKVCDLVPTETSGGTYRCSEGKITLNSGANSLDFSGILQLAGDLPPQNGTVDAYDISFVRNCLGKSTEECLNGADVNHDGKVDTQDYSLIIAALSIRNDEE